MRIMRAETAYVINKNVVVVTGVTLGLHETRPWVVQYARFYSAPAARKGRAAVAETAGTHKSDRGYRQKAKPSGYEWPQHHEAVTCHCLEAYTSRCAFYDLRWYSRSRISTLNARWTGERDRLQMPKQHGSLRNSTALQIYETTRPGSETTTISSRCQHMDQ